MKNEHINWTLGFKCDHWFWPWPWHTEFTISQPKMVLLPRNKKQTYRLNSRPQMWPMGLTLTITLTFEFSRSNVTLTFDHTHDLDHGFSWSNFEIAVSQNGGLIDIAQRGGSRSFIIMTMTIWWPRSGVWIYQIVTGVTSVVGVPSTHLVTFDNWNKTYFKQKHGCQQQGTSIPSYQRVYWNTVTRRICLCMVIYRLHHLARLNLFELEIGSVGSVVSVWWSSN